MFNINVTGKIVIISWIIDAFCNLYLTKSSWFWLNYVAIIDVLNTDIVIDQCNQQWQT